MPIYEYKCNHCGVINEFLIMDKNEKILCKSCGSNDLGKLLSAHNTLRSDSKIFNNSPGGCCGAPNSCSSPGSCCSG